MPKAGLSTEEYEDAFAPQEIPEKDLKEFRCAVSDGATETSFSGLWAKILCEAFLENSSDRAALQALWLKEVSGKNLPWYAEEKLEAGAFASFLGLYLKEEKKTISWTANAVGDSCLFLIREKKILLAMPLDRWESFDYTPALISTKETSNAGLEKEEKRESGIARRGDIFYLMTDAISKWLLRREEEHKDAIEQLEKIETAEELKTLVDEQRQSKDEQGRTLMTNDDITWTRIAL
ncbi:MAG: protein phosphatase 2C domain-containing protein [Candidatus Obscuribacterales bacterium]|nr:protein phosphatase 2C domain-containing protein [Candidatus Obscuribacterales bacterium]